MPARWWRKVRPRRCWTDPRHPYTWALLHAAPRIDAETREPAARHHRGPAAGSARLAGGLPLPRPLPVRGRRSAPSIRNCCRSATRRTARCWVTQQGGSLHPPHACARRRPPRPWRPPAAHAIAGSCRRQQALSAAAGGTVFAASRPARGRWRRSHGHARRDGRPCRRVRLRQVHAGAAGRRACMSRRPGASCSTASTLPTRRRASSGRCAGACR